MSKRWRYYGCFSIGCGTLCVLLLPILWMLMSLNGRERLLYFTRPPSESQLVEQLGGERVAEILRNPDRVEAVLLAPPDPPGGDWLPHEYKVVSEATSVPDVVASDISQTLLNPNLHRILGDGAYSCTVQWGVRITYVAGPHRVDLYLCFTCSDLAVYLDGKLVGEMKFLFVEERLLRAARRIFPDNAELRKLEEMIGR
jgi:hypothetical protein